MAVFIFFLFKALQAFQDMGGQKRQPAQNFAQVVSGATQQGVHGITLGSFEEVSSQAPICFHVPNYRLHRITTPSAYLVVLSSRTSLSAENKCQVRVPS
jgi:hypothetical protein